VGNLAVSVQEEIPRLQGWEFGRRAVKNSRRRSVGGCSRTEITAVWPEQDQPHPPAIREPGFRSTRARGSAILRYPGCNRDPGGCPPLSRGLSKQ
jgi:hypothetical protein